MECNHTYNQQLDTLNPSSKDKLCSLCLDIEVKQLKKESATYLGDAKDAFDEIEKLKAKNDLLCKAINDQQTQRWKMKQDKIIVEEERDKLKADLSYANHQLKENIEMIKLATDVITDSKNLCEGLKRTKETYRKLHPGGCRMFSQGDDCQCLLCQIDEVLKGGE